MIHIGIDPGVNTGIAISRDKELQIVKTCPAIEAERIVIGWSCKDVTAVYIEDARLRKWVTGGREKLQGVGSVKRDCLRWEEFCKYYGLIFKPIAPKNNTTKLDAETFKNLTGWQGKTSEHSRDASMLVWGRI